MEERYVGLLKAGADARMPARMGEARELLVRARREHAGGLEKDAAYTLGAVDMMLTAIERDLQRWPGATHRSRAKG